MIIRTRMAPSPTGEYHIGGMRTFLYNYAFAKTHGGKMVLRIEDTDKNREVEGALQRLMTVIREYGLNWDEGPDVGGPYEPYVQSERLSIYREYAQKLIGDGNAYYCFCTEERLRVLREEQKVKGEITRYDKLCLSLDEREIRDNLASKKPYVVRLNVPENKNITWHDLIVGPVTINTSEIDHQVLLKSDGYPTYHLAVVVDDYLMKITHVLRGNEWLPSTPKQILLYEFFGWDIPEFGHLPNLKEVGANKKLSKRYGDVHAAAFLEKGYLPEALLNFLMFLGWNPGSDKEIYSLEEFVTLFDIERVHKTDLVSFDRDKLLWYNGFYIRQLSPKELVGLIKDWTKKYAPEFGFDYVDSDLLKIVPLVQERMKLLSEFWELTKFFFKEPDVDVTLLQSFAAGKALVILNDYISLYQGVPNSNWNVSYVDEVSHKLLAEKGYKPKEAFMTIRVAVTGEKATPPLFDTLDVLGKEVTIMRMLAAVELLKNQE